MLLFNHMSLLHYLMILRYHGLLVDVEFKDGWLILMMLPLF